MRALDPELRVVMRINNWEDIIAAFGGAAGVKMREAILNALTRPGMRCAILPDDGHHVQIYVQDLYAIRSKPEDPESPEALISLLLEAIGSLAVSFSGATLHLAPSIARISHHPRQADAPDRTGEYSALVTVSRSANHSAPVSRTEEWKAGYRKDMALAAIFFEALACNRLQLAWQPVRHASTGVDILYHECLLRMIDAEGGLQLPGHFIPALERLGLIRPLDKFVVQRVVDELRAAPSITLAANISAQSVVSDGWWHALRESLVAAPDVAARLVLEITESAELLSMSAATAFITTMREMGCKIAVDDFGMGHASLHHLVALKPDIVKIDAFYACWALQAPETQAALAHLIALLATLAPIVIVEGVGSDGQSAAILNAGAIWQQGYHHGSPTVVRPSKYAGTGERLNNEPIVSVQVHDRSYHRGTRLEAH
jgi:EAL domain-containing protein (putative c-di-GMP-specific phosphodiesterase class I)